MTGAKITLNKEPQKIVSLAPSCTEIIYAIGAGDKLVAGSNWDTYPEEALSLEKVGDTYKVNYERIIELKADIVLVDGSFDVNAANTLSAAGIPIYSVKEAQVDDIYYVTTLSA
jgi:iron complex transport system substrate-binding protein